MFSILNPIYRYKLIRCSYYAPSHISMNTTQCHILTKPARCCHSHRLFECTPTTKNIACNLYSNHVELQILNQHILTHIHSIKYLSNKKNERGKIQPIGTLSHFLYTASIQHTVLRTQRIYKHQRSEYKKTMKSH